MSAERATKDLAFCSRRLADFGRPEVSTKAEARKARKEEKTAKAPAASTSRRAPRSLGKLRAFINMPLDILAEVASHLTPLDLLHLARVSRQFRAVFTSRTARHMWAAARANFDGLPDCPADLTEAAYARLLFEKECDACGLCPARVVCYQIRIRMCKPCYQLNVKKGTTLLKNSTYVPTQEQSTVFSLMPSASNYLGSSDSHTKYDSYYKPEYTWVAERYMELLRMGDRSSLDQFVAHRKHLVSQILESGIQLRRWETFWQEQKIEDDNRVSGQRYEDIITRLLDLGYSEEDFPSDDTEWSNICCQPRPLTDRVWKSIETKLKGLIEEQREMRAMIQLETNLQLRRSETAELLPVFVSQRDTDSNRVFVRPNILMLDKLVSLNSLLREAQATIPVTMARLDSIADSLLADLGVHRLRIKQCFVDLLSKSSSCATSPFWESPSVSYTDVSLSEAECDTILHRPSSLFWCQYCDDRIMDYREILCHSHSFRMVSAYLPRSITSDPSHFALRALRDCGLSEDITSDALAELSGRFACLCGTPGFEAVNFVDLVHHLAKSNRTYHRNRRSRFLRAEDYTYASIFNFHGDESQTPRVRLLAQGETISQSQDITHYPEGTLCVHCYALHRSSYSTHRERCLLQNSVQAGLHMRHMHRLVIWDEQDICTEAEVDEHITTMKQRAAQRNACTINDNGLNNGGLDMLSFLAGHPDDDSFERDFHDWINRGD